MARTILKNPSTTNGCSAGAPNKRVLPQTVPKRVPRSSRVPCSSRHPRAVFHGPGARCSARDAHGRPGKGGSHLAWPRGRLSGVAARRGAATGSQRRLSRCRDGSCRRGRLWVACCYGWRAAGGDNRGCGRRAAMEQSVRARTAEHGHLPAASVPCVPPRLFSMNVVRVCNVTLVVSFELLYIRTLISVI